MSILKSMMTTTAFIIVIVAAALLSLFVFQNKLLYYPTKANIDNYAPGGMSLWPIDESAAQYDTENLLGLYAPAAADSQSIGTAIVFHGNAGHAGHRSYYAQQLAPLGLNTILAEYPGYGPRGSKPTEESIINDALATVKLAAEQHPQPIWVIGESLGAAVAAAVAGKLPDLVEGLILLTPWNTLEEVAQHHYPFLPVSWLLRSEYDSVAALASYTGPTYIVVSRQDNVIPVKFGKELYEQIGQPKQLLELEHAGHNNWINHVPDTFWSDAMQWLQRAK